MDESLVKIRHERSKKDFPGLKLEDDEYVELAFRRAKICLIMIFVAIFFSVAVILMAFLLAILSQSMLDEMGKNFIFIILSSLLASAIIIGIISIIIYRHNRLFVTNKHVIHMTMDSLVSNSVNVIDLISVEDVSFHQKGILQNLLHYGTLRLATVGDETTYTFKYSDISPSDLNTVTKIITSAKKKLGRSSRSPKKNLSS